VDLGWCIGTSLWTIFEHFLQTTDRHRVEGAVHLYRHIYRDGPMFEYTVYDGVMEALHTLQAYGVRLVVATAKVHEYAREVIGLSPIARYISHVYGSEMDGTNVEKRDLIRHVLHEERISPEEAVMVGDRHHDVDGARANGVPAIAVAYGYGNRDEWSRADALISSPHELVSTVRSLSVSAR
jgi:phosphoglycolate phosphatase